jgi:hypothetical protein
MRRGNSFRILLLPTLCRDAARQFVWDSSAKNLMPRCGEAIRLGFFCYQPYAAMRRKLCHTIGIRSPSRGFRGNGVPPRCGEAIRLGFFCYQPYAAMRRIKSSRKDAKTQLISRKDAIHRTQRRRDAEKLSVTRGFSVLLIMIDGGIHYCSHNIMGDIRSDITIRIQMV